METKPLLRWVNGERHWPAPWKRRFAFPELKLVYLQIPKAACTSIKSALMSASGMPVPADDFDVHVIQSNEIEASALDTEYRDYFKFSFVRNPWERLVSCYVDKIKPTRDFQGRAISRGVFRPFRNYVFGVPYFRRELFFAGMSFEAFIDVVCRIPDEKSNSHFASQHIFLCNPNGELFVDFVGRFERLGEDFRAVFEKVGALPVSLPVRMTSKHAPYADYYTEATREKVRRRYKKDIELFGYEF